jgi:signal peptidase I
MHVPQPQTVHQEHSIVETLQSLIVAFVLAMTFRGFVTEGFVIPTGSMAPTLLGEHILWTSDQSGYAFALDSGAIPHIVMDDKKRGRTSRLNIVDPMLGAEAVVTTKEAAELLPLTRMGDRILVLKCLYPFAAPERFDVVVFKNPEDPIGDKQNYIKRLIGLPDEKIWLADGDVFAAPSSAPGDREGFEIQRKPEHVQRAVWRPVAHSDWIATSPQTLPVAVSPPWEGGPDWRTAQTREYRTDSTSPGPLRYSTRGPELTDWTAYNMFGYQIKQRSQVHPVSDLRVAAAVTADSAGLSTMLELQARHHEYQFLLDNGTATVRMRPGGQSQGWTIERSESASAFEPGAACDVEFWHVDQSMSIWINGEKVVELEYPWSPIERLQFATGKSIDQVLDDLDRFRPVEPALSWTFAGSPVSLQRVRVDRDLYYQPYLDDEARGANPDDPMVLGPDHFFMLGDNSPASSDSRYWRTTHPLVAEQIDPARNVVHRRLLLGKAWVVYFPAPYGLNDSGRRFIPDFGRMRFIR